MIIIRLKGGLGNQLFQYAYGIYMSKKYRLPLKFDKSNFINSSRKYSLGWFNINIPEAPNPKKNLIISIKNLIRKIKIKIYSYLGKIYNDTCSGEGIFEGYWHFIKYPESMKNKLQETIVPKRLSFSLNKIVKKLESHESVMIHVRKGDYLTNKKINKLFGTCDLSYYNNAIEEILKLFPNSKFYVFSDNVEWAKLNLKSKTKLKFISQYFSDTEQFWLMTRCKHHIISNSSFSWWAAWLRDHKKKITIYPEPWYDNLTYNKKIFPKHWLKRKKNG